MASYLNSLWSGMGGGNQQQEQSEPGNSGESEQQEQKGIMSSIFSKGAKMATSAVGASPEADLQLTAPPNQRLYFINGDEISGALSLTVPNTVQHQGIRVILRGIISNQSNDVYFGAKIGGMIGSGSQYEFIQLTRDLDGPGQLNQGTFDYKFQFKNVDLDVDSYSGIALDVRFEVTAEMVYEGSMMNYTVQDSRIFQVRNSKPSTAASPAQVSAQPAQSSDSPSTEEVKQEEEGQQEKAVTMIDAPRMRIDFCGFRASEKPCEVEVYLHNTYLHIDRDQISGYLRMKQLASEIQSRIKNVKIQLIMQEVQGSTKSLPMPQTGQDFADQMNSGCQPYRLRVVKDFQIMDGCCDEGDTIDFRLPLRGACGRYLCPSVKNVYNKFSVRFFVRFIFFVKVRYRVAAKKKRESTNEGASSEEESDREALSGDSDFENIESFSEQTEVSSNFLEVQLWR